MTISAANKLILETMFRDVEGFCTGRRVQVEGFAFEMATKAQKGGGALFQDRQSLQGAIRQEAVGFIGTYLSGKKTDIEKIPYKASFPISTAVRKLQVEDKGGDLEAKQLEILREYHGELRKGQFPSAGVVPGTKQ